MLIQSWADGARRLFGAWLRGNKGMAAFLYADEILCQEFPYSLTELDTNRAAIPFNNSDEIHFENVTFSYSSENSPAIKNVNLQIKKGSQIAIVGSSGSGKSTFLHLLFGFYKPQSGTIRFDDVPMGQDNVQSIQQIIAVFFTCHAMTILELRGQMQPSKKYMMQPEKLISMIKSAASLMDMTRSSAMEV